MRLRTLALLAVVLVLLSSLAYAGRNRSAAGDPVISTVGPPSLVAQPSSGSVPVRVDAAHGEADLGVAAQTGTAAQGVGDAVSSMWVSRTATQSGISATAIAAYGAAVLTAPASCHLGWTTLAGIGWVESQHGTLSGRVLDAGGRPSTPIIGPALDGGAYPAIAATASSTALHGDPEWDHAVGPLQFLPSTWQTWGRDGDGDGVADPQDLNDAATAAAAYLCGTGQDLTTGAGWSAAVFAYNHSDTYVRDVFAAASIYAARTDR